MRIECYLFSSFKIISSFTLCSSTVVSTQYWIKWFFVVYLQSAHSPLPFSEWNENTAKYTILLEMVFFFDIMLSSGWDIDIRPNAYMNSTSHQICMALSTPFISYRISLVQVREQAKCIVIYKSQNFEKHNDRTGHMIRFWWSCHSLFMFI